MRTRSLFDALSSLLGPSQLGMESERVPLTVDVVKPLDLEANTRSLPLPLTEYGQKQPLLTPLLSCLHVSLAQPFDNHHGL